MRVCREGVKAQNCTMVDSKLITYSGCGWWFVICLVLVHHWGRDEIMKEGSCSRLSSYRSRHSPHRVTTGVLRRYDMVKGLD